MSRSEDERLEEVDAVLGRAEVHDRLARGHERQLPPLEAVPGMVGVAVVGAEEQLEHALGVDALARAEGADGREGRRHEDAAEVEEHCLHGWHAWSLTSLSADYQ